MGITRLSSTKRITNVLYTLMYLVFTNFKRHYPSITFGRILSGLIWLLGNRDVVLDITFYLHDILIHTVNLDLSNCHDQYVVPFWLWDASCIIFPLGISQLLHHSLLSQASWSSSLHQIQFFSSLFNLLGFPRQLSYFTFTYLAISPSTWLYAGNIRIIISL